MFLEEYITKSTTVAGRYDVPKLGPSHLYGSTLLQITYYSAHSIGKKSQRKKKSLLSYRNFSRIPQI